MYLEIQLQSVCGPQFNLKYNGTFVMNALTDILPTHQQGDTEYFHQNNQPPIEATILSMSLNDNEEAYVNQAVKSGDIFEVKNSELFDSNLSSM